MNENEDTTYQDLQDSGKTLLRGKFIKLSDNIRKEGRSQINYVSSQLKKKKKWREKNKINLTQAEGKKK